MTLDNACPKPERSPRKPRRGLPPSSSRPPRTAPPRKKKPRSSDEVEMLRAFVYGPPGFVEWVQRQPSVASGKGPCEAAHAKGRGAKLKGHWTTIVPLTRHEHRAELHQEMGQQTFEAHYGISLEAKARETHRAFVAFSGGAENEEETA